MQAASMKPVTASLTLAGAIAIAIAVAAVTTRNASVTPTPGLQAAGPAPAASATPPVAAATQQAPGAPRAMSRQDAILALPNAFPRTPEFDFVTPVPGSYRLPPIKAAADGPLLDHTGADVRLAGYWKGRISLVSFVYLTCGDQNGCPLAMSVLYDIEHASRDHEILRAHAQLMTISFDPARDPPAALDALAAPKARDIAEGRVMPWHFFTGSSEAALAPMLAAFGQRVDKDPDSDRLNHLLRMFLVDSAGRIRNIYGLGTIDPRLIMADVSTLLLEGADR